MAKGWQLSAALPLRPVLERIRRLGGGGFDRENDMTLAVEPLHGVGRLADLFAGLVHLEAAEGVDGIEREQRLAHLVPVSRAGLLDRRLAHVAGNVAAAGMIAGLVAVLGLVLLVTFLGARKLERGLPLGIAHDALGVEP